MIVQNFHKKVNVLNGSRQVCVCIGNVGCQPDCEVSSPPLNTLATGCMSPSLMVVPGLALWHAALGEVCALRGCVRAPHYCDDSPWGTPVAPLSEFELVVILAQVHGAAINLSGFVYDGFRVGIPDGIVNEVQRFGLCSLRDFSSLPR